MKKIYIEEINYVLRNSFNLEKDKKMPEVPIFFIDTESDDDTESDNEKAQFIVDIIIKRIKLNSVIYKAINTENLSNSGYNVQKGIEKEKKM